MQVVLISTYELGRQPYGLASPAAWLRAALDSVLAGQEPERPETDPVGCSVKWRG